MKRCAVRCERFALSAQSSTLTARTEAQSRTGFRLTICDAQGHAGVGEAAPFPGYSRETAEQCHASLNALEAPLQTLLCADEVSSFSQWQHVVPQLRLGEHAASAAFAVETAVIDLCARRGGVSAHRWINPGARTTRIAVNATLDLRASPASLRSQLAAYAQRGFDVFKLKVGHPDWSWRDERARLELARDVLGDDATLRLDANGVLSPRDLPHRIEIWRRAGIAFVEEPGPVSQWAPIRDAGISVAADESLACAAHRSRIVDERLADVLVIKPAMLHGITGAWALAQRAAALDMRVVVTHLFDGPVALAACRALAFALPQPPLACGLDTHEGLAGWPPGCGVALGEGPVLAPNESLGLGCCGEPHS